MSQEKNCWSCAYREAIPGNEHISCLRVFADVKPPKAQKTRWYNFPLNFDPVWQEEECKGWANSRDPRKTAKISPLGEMFRLLV